MPQTFKKGERLCSRSQIKRLFEGANVQFVFPLKLLWKKSEEESSFPVQIVISVPKKNIRKAVIRNKIKRKIREAYRKNKYLLEEDPIGKQVKCTAIFIYTGREEIAYRDIESKIILLLQRLKQDYAKDCS